MHKPKMRKNPKHQGTSATKAPEQRSDDAIVVADAQKFFHTHGYYRTEDVHRIFGDPSGGVTVATSSDLVFSASQK